MSEGDEEPRRGEQRDREHRLDAADPDGRTQAACRPRPFFDVRRNTPSRWVRPWMHASAVIQLAERLMTRALSARRHEIVVQWRSVHVMQTVAMMMSDIGRSEVSPLERHQREVGARQHQSR